MVFDPQSRWRASLVVCAENEVCVGSGDLPLHFLAFQYGCNSVGFIFCTFITFVRVLVIRCVWKDKIQQVDNLKIKDKCMQSITLCTHAPLG